MRHIVIIRFSAISDVAVAAPLVRAYATANPEISFTMVSDSFLRPLFENIPNLNFLPEDFDEENYSIHASIKIAHDILSLKPTDVVDLQHSKLTKIIRNCLTLKGIPVSAVRHEEFERKKLQSHKAEMSPVISLYEDALAEAGLINLHLSRKTPEKKVFGKYMFRRIGIAPFAKYPGKSWPIKYMEEVVAALGDDPNSKVYLFGNKTKEAAILQGWQDKYEGCESIAGKYTLSEELELMRSLDLMVTMDSANMHFASFVNTPVISIWGATDAKAGFYGWGQDPENAVCSEIACRPCSLYGDAKCERLDYACLARVTPAMVLEKINAFFNTNSEK